MQISFPSARVQQIAAALATDALRSERRRAPACDPPAEGGEDDDDGDDPGRNPNDPKEPCCPRGVQMSLIAAGKGHLACLRIAIALYPIHPDACTAAALGNHLDCLALLLSHNAPWGTETTCAAALHSHFDSLQYLLEKGCSYEDDLLISAAKGGNLTSLQYLIDMRGMYMSVDVFQAAFEYAHPECVAYLIEMGCPFNGYSFREENEWYLCRRCHTAPGADKRFLDCIVCAVDHGWSINPEGEFECPNLVRYILDNANRLVQCREHVRRVNWQA